MKKMSAILISLAIFSFALTSCITNTASVTNTNSTTNILNELCGSTCWHEIIVGATSKDDLKDILLSSPDVDQASVSESKRTGVFDEKISFKYSPNKTFGNRYVAIDANLIDETVVTLDLYQNLDITLQDVVAIFGNPDIVSADKDHSGYLNVTFVNKNGVYYGVQVDDENSALSPDLQVEALELFDPKMYQDLLTSEWFILGYDKGINLYQWSGYKIINGNYWPPR